MAFYPKNKMSGLALCSQSAFSSKKRFFVPNIPWDIRSFRISGIWPDIRYLAGYPAVLTDFDRTVLTTPTKSTQFARRLRNTSNYLEINIATHISKKMLNPTISLQRKSKKRSSSGKQVWIPLWNLLNLSSYLFSSYFLLFPKICLPIHTRMIRR